MLYGTRSHSCRLGIMLPLTGLMQPCGAAQRIHLSNPSSPRRLTCFCSRCCTLAGWLMTRAAATGSPLPLPGIVEHTNPQTLCLLRGSLFLVILAHGICFL